MATRRRLSRLSLHLAHCSANNDHGEPKWKLMYWPATRADGTVLAGAGRGEYVRVIFEEAGVPYEEVDDPLLLSTFFGMRKTSAASDASSAEKASIRNMVWPLLAPPAIVSPDGSFQMAQTADIARYLGKKFGLYPPASKPEQQARADQVLSTIHEYIAEGRLSFHPVKNTMSYWDQVAEAQPYIRAFVKERAPRYLAHFESLLAFNCASSAGGSNNEQLLCFVGSTVSVVDLHAWVMLDVTLQQWPEDAMLAPYPKLAEFKAQVEARPRIRAYLASDRKRPFAGDSLM